MLDRMEVMRKPVEIYDAEFSFPYVELHTKELLTVKDLLIGYDKPLLPAVSFTLASDTRMWLRGTNGIGKTTMVKTIMGLLAKKAVPSAFILPQNRYISSKTCCSITSKIRHRRIYRTSFRE